MPANTELWKAHDIAQQLQDQIEILPRVERAFVHIDHESTHRPVRILQSNALIREHKVSVQEHRKEK
jgi:divalent metal cation (Fe/Co/Zn/Cd) transporter